MKIHPSKFALALGITCSIAFLLCYIVLTIGGSSFSLSIVNTLFHDMDFKSLMIENSFSFVKTLGGMIILFLEGLLIGFLTASVYNAFNKQPV